MKAVRARRANAQPKIDLGERSHLYGHGRKIVSHLAPEASRFQLSLGAGSSSN
jgi:hypothetical protein